MNETERVLVLAPHTDDAEFGCGGFICQLLERGCEVHQVAFSAAEDSLPEGWDPDTLRHEVERAACVLGLPRGNLRVLKYPVQRFQEYRQSILDDMIRLGSDLKSSMVLLPSPNDTHQDHQVIAHEGFRAFKRATMLGYELPWNNLTFVTNAFAVIDERHLRKKIEAIACYNSQNDRAYMSPDFVLSLARVRGTQIGCQYAEVFEVVRWVLR